MGETSHDGPNRPRRIEERTETEQPFSFQLAGLEFQSVGGRIAQFVLRPPNPEIQIIGLRARLGAEAISTIMAVGADDEEFSPRLLAEIRQIELEPLGFPTHSACDDIRLAHFDHRGIRWQIAFQIDSAEYTAFILRVCPLGPAIIAQST